MKDILIISKKDSGWTLHSVFLTLVFILCFVSANAQTKDPITLADSLYALGDYQPAITEYKRFLFFNKNDEQAAQVYARIGKCYRNLYDWDNAEEYYNNAIAYANNDSLRAEYKIALGIVYISSKDFIATEKILLPLASFSELPTIQSKASFFLSLTYIYCHKWKKAREYLDNNILSSDSSMNFELNQLLEKAANTKYKSPTHARWLSTFIPGLGQVYAGQPLSALNAIAINFATGYLLYDTIDKHPSFIEIYTYGSLFHRFYSGNRHNAERYVHERNEKKDKELETELLQVIDKMME